MDKLEQVEAAIARIEAAQGRTFTTGSKEADNVVYPLIAQWMAIKDMCVELRERRADSARLDWLGLEVAREMEEPRYGKPRSLFRRNLPITRETIDAAMRGAPE